MQRLDPVPCLAARFAAKEATIKALSAGRSSGISLKEITVGMAEGIPQIHLTGRAFELSQRTGSTRIHVSISHDKGCAVAVVMLERV